MLRSCRWRVVDRVVVDREPRTRPAEFRRVAFAGGLAVSLSGFQGRRVQRVSAIAFASILCAKEIVGRAESRTRFESHRVSRGGCRRQTADIVDVIQVTTNVIPLTANDSRHIRIQRRTR